jgi:hypothetical protein
MFVHELVNKHILFTCKLVAEVAKSKQKLKWLEDSNHIGCHALSLGE